MKARRILGRCELGRVCAEAEALLLDLVDAAWKQGWQPAELLRHGRRSSDVAAGERLVAAAIATDHANRRSTTLDRAWVDHVEALELPVVNGRSGWVRRWASEEGFDNTRAITLVVATLVVLAQVPPLDPVLPPPGTKGPAGTVTEPRVRGTESDPLLKRIRALLAKAESTEHEAEATAFTAKAHELMARHAVDQTMVADGGGERPVFTRLPVDAPYVNAKSYLLQVVAEANRCEAVYMADTAMSTVVGFAADVSAVEALFTSLLVQAQSALDDAARTAPPGTRVRSKSYRTSFLSGYAARIRQRLAEVNDAIYSEADEQTGGAFLPALRSRSAEVGDYVEELFDTIVTSPMRGGSDPFGHMSGSAAADVAKLTAGDLGKEDGALPVGP